MSVLDLNYNYASLSLRDLLEARDAYHYHLLSKANVIGTAVGLYLIRKDEDWPQRKGEGRKPANRKTYPRTLANSEVRDYSWPCIYAFVRSWEPEDAFGRGGNYDAALIVPKTLYLSDGRAVPVCVVLAEEAPNEEGVYKPVQTQPADKFGSGSPIIVHVQNEEHMATAGCLVTDGHLTYALTARHACGEAGTKIASRLHDGEKQIGVSSPLQKTRMPFSDVYPDFPGRRSYVALDVGLIRLDDLNDWTSNTYGLPPVGALADVHERNLSLKLIDQPVVGWGASSGLLSGTLKALFYRHRSVGGYDYVGDFLISPGDGVGTKPGDSGMVWHLDVTEYPQDGAKKPLAMRDLRPLAVEWGGQVFDESGQRTAFAIATSLSNVCKLLDVELVTDLARGVSGYWGRTGHYSIAAFAARTVGNTRLKQFLIDNAEIISFDLDAIQKKDFDKSVGKLGDDFVPLADVPDEIWKKLTTGKNAREGGRDEHGSKTGSDGPEHPNHYADIDAPIGTDGKTVRALCLEDDKNLTPAAWKKFYATLAQEAKANGDSVAATQYKTPFKQGLLPFRVWQLYDAMVDFAKRKDVVGYLTVAGVAAHYIGDASQPLHGSIYADGDRSRTVTREHPRTGESEEVSYGKGVHSAFETTMLSYKAVELIAHLDKRVPTKHGLDLCSSGREMAMATIMLMDKVAGILPPLEILEIYEKAGGNNNHSTLDAMWKKLGKRTEDVMIQGTLYLAMLWESAWVEGNGDEIASSKLTVMNKTAVRNRYIDPDFVPSLTLDQIGKVLKK